MLMAMSSSRYLYALGLFFLFAKLFRQQRLPLVVVAVLLNYAAVEKIIPGWGQRAFHNTLSTSSWVPSGARR